LQNNKKIYHASVAKQKLKSLYEFSNIFFGFSIFSLIHTFKIKKCIWRKYSVFSFFFDRQPKNIKKISLFNSGYFNSEQEFSIFPLFFFVKPS
jgi:hypothetical protein